MNSSHLTTVTHRAMATEFAIMLPEGDAHLMDAALSAIEWLDEIESKLTIYDRQSEISQVNAFAAERSVPLSSETFGLIQSSQSWSEKTQGAFDVTAGPLIDAWGFTRRRGKKPTSIEIESALERVGYQHVCLNDTDRSIRFAKSGMSINLGGIGKGHAIDQILFRLKEAGVRNALVHGGNSSIAAIGNRYGDPSDSQDESGASRGWPVGLAHPTKPKRRLGVLNLYNQALSTSGSGKQFFHHRGRRYGHVIDPRTGYPAGDLLSLTVLSNHATDAEALSTAMFVAGSHTVREFHERIEKNNHGFCAGESPSAFPMVAVSQGDRQDSVLVERFGEIGWETAERLG